MFIDVTRHGGGRVLRVAVAAIAYLDACEGGTALHLIGGETIRAVETPAQIEERAAPLLVAREVMCTQTLTADEIVEAWRHMTAALAAPASPTIAVPTSPGEQRTLHRKDHR